MYPLSDFIRYPVTRLKCQTSVFSHLSYLSVPLFHGPDADDDPAADPEHPGELAQRPHAALRRGDVVDDGDRQRRVHALVAERQQQVITVQNLQKEEESPLLNLGDFSTYGISY